MFFRKLLTACFLLILNVATAEIVDVNQTAILVSDTVANDPLKLKQAFAQIVANSTGENIIDILSNPVFNSADIKKGVKRSYFEKINTKYFQNKQHKFWFHLVMDDDFVQTVIQQAGFSLLPHNREKIMLWIVKESINPPGFENVQPNKEMVLSYAHDDEQTMYWIKRWAEYMGVALVMPVMDEQDRLLVSVNSIKSLSFEAIDQSNMRYKNPQSLLVYIKNSTDTVKIRTGLTIKGNDMSIKHFQKQSSAENAVEEGEMLYSVILEVAQQYAKTYKIRREDLEKHTVRFVVQALENYSQVIFLRKYLSSLSVIETYDIVSASKGELVLNVNVSVSTEAFLRIIQRENTLIYDKNSPLNQLFFSLAKTEK